MTDPQALQRSQSHFLDPSLALAQWNRVLPTVPQCGQLALLTVGLPAGKLSVDLFDPLHVTGRVEHQCRVKLVQVFVSYQPEVLQKRVVRTLFPRMANLVEHALGLGDPVKTFGSLLQCRRELTGRLVQVIGRPGLDRAPEWLGAPALHKYIPVRAFPTSPSVWVLPPAGCCALASARSIIVRATLD